MFKTVAVIAAVVALIFGFFGLSPAFGEEEKCISSSPAPKIREAWFNKAPEWDSTTGKYWTSLLLRFEPIAPPLFLEISVNWINKNGSGVKYHDPIDVSQWARTGSFGRRRSFEFAGEYTYIVRLRNEAGESCPAVSLPPLKVGR